MALTLRMDPGGSPGTDGGRSPARQAPAAAGSSPSAAARKAPRARRCPTCQQAFSGEARFCPFDGDALAEAPDYNPTADPLIGQLVDGRYEVMGVIGEGGMGTVYEVRHAALGRRFALKVLRRDIADAEHTARFIQEAKAAAAIGHPNIVAVSDFGELPAEGGKSGPRVPYFVMEHLTGISLAALLRAEKTLEPRRAADLLLQCAAGLAAAHAAGVIHRDLKPDNVFLTRNAEREFVKLLDFGVAKMAGAGRLTRAGMVFGTPHYMSPEQAAGQAVDQRADVYALGVILYECLSGRVPFEADTYMGVLTKHMFATPEPIDRLVPDAAGLGALGAVVMRCLAKNPADRYAGMAEVAAALEAAAEAPSRSRGARASGRRAASQRAPAPSEPVETPLKPIVGPLGVGLGVLAVALVGFLVVREVLSRREIPRATIASASAMATVTAVATASSLPPAIASATPPAPPPVDSAAPPVVTAATVAAPATARPRTVPAVTSSRPNADPRKRPPSGDLVDPWGR